MRHDVIARLVNSLVKHDEEEKRLINLCKALNCKPSELPKEEQLTHDMLEWQTMDLFFEATTDEANLAIDIYDSFHVDFI